MSRCMTLLVSDRERPVPHGKSSIRSSSSETFWAISIDYLRPRAIRSRPRGRGHTSVLTDPIALQSYHLAGIDRLPFAKSCLNRGSDNSALVVGDGLDGCQGIRSAYLA